MNKVGKKIAANKDKISGGLCCRKGQKCRGLSLIGRYKIRGSRKIHRWFAESSSQSPSSIDCCNTGPCVSHITSREITASS